MLLGIPVSYEMFLQNNNVNLSWYYSMVFLLSNALIFVLINQILKQLKGQIFVCSKGHMHTKFAYFQKCPQ